MICSAPTNAVSHLFAFWISYPQGRDKLSFGTKEAVFSVSEPLARRGLFSMSRWIPVWPELRGPDTLPCAFLASARKHR
jgi:hypothetical protein